VSACKSSITCFRTSRHHRTPKKLVNVHRHHSHTDTLLTNQKKPSSEDDVNFTNYDDNDDDDDVSIIYSPSSSTSKGVNASARRDAKTGNRAGSSNPGLPPRHRPNQQQDHHRPSTFHPERMAPPARPPATANPSSGSKGPKSEYISTDTGNKVARRSQLHGTQHIILGGRAVIQPQVCIRGDLIRLPHPPATTNPSSSSASSTTATTTTTAGTTQSQPQSQPTVSVSIGRYSFISTSAVLRPPSKLSRGVLSYHALRVGEHVLIGADAVVEAAAIGDRVVIGEGSVVGRFAILKEGCVVLPGAVVPGGMVVPSGMVAGGRPARLVGEVGDGWKGGDLREMWRQVG
jgi:dynactin-5